MQSRCTDVTDAYQLFRLLRGEGIEELLVEMAAALRAANRSELRVDEKEVLAAVLIACANNEALPLEATN